MKQYEMVERYQGLPRYVRAYPINEENKNVTEMKNWISGYRAFQRGAKKTIVNITDDYRWGTSQVPRDRQCGV